MKSNKSQNTTRVFARALQLVFLLFLGLAPMVLGGCAGFVSGANTTPPPPSSVNITNVQTTSTTTSGTQVVWTTDVASNSVVSYGTTVSYGSSTPVDSTMVTTHQVTVSGLSAGTTYYYQVQSTDSKNNNGKSGGHKFATQGISISGTITPSKGGAGATVTLSGTANATATANSSGAYTFGGLASGFYAVTPSNAGYTFSPVNQNVNAGTTDVTSVNFTASGSVVFPSITTQPASQTVTAGQAATFSVLASGTAPLTYQWQKNGLNIAGATSASYTTPATTTSDSGSTFAVVVSNSAGNATSNAATLTVNAAPVAPTITAQPTNQTVTAGQTALFTVSATGTAPLSYQWRKNGANIAGATSASYTTPATTTSDSGSTFVVVVSNSAGTATSNATTLTVNPVPVAPSITTQPTNQTVTAGQAATFTVTAAGSAPLSYQWQKNGANISGATSASYTTPATTSSDNGSTFRAVVTNSAGTVTSNSATLTVNVPPTITTQPANQTVTAGQAATFSVVAGGTAPLSYQWRKNGANIAGATSASYATPATTSSDNGSAFLVVVTNSAGTVTSNSATLTVNAPPTITTQPASQTVVAGQTATFTVVAIGTAPLSYQWQKNGANIAGATSASYTTPATTTSDSGSMFVAVVSNSVGTVTSGGAILTVNSAPVAPTFTTQPANQTVTAGQTATFSVVAGGTSPLSYQWQKNAANIAGATSASYTTPATTTSDSGSTFDVVVTNNAGTATSNSVTLTVNAAVVAPSITTQPVNQTVTAGQTATFSVVATGTAPLSYQWQKNGANISGATSASYTTPATTTSDTGSTFAVVVSNSAGTATSNAATLTVTPAPVAPTITTQPANQTVTAGQTATFSVVATGTAPLSYQWQKNGSNISGATSASYTTPATTTSDSGSTFVVVVSNSAGTATSNAATLTVNPAPVAPTITTQPANQAVTAGQTATFSVIATGTAPLSYQWQKNGANISGATSASYTTPATTTADSGSTFKVVVSNSVGSATSNAATLTVNPAPAPAIGVNPTSISFGNVVVGSNLSQSLIISNTGNATLTITQINVTGATFNATGYTLPLSVNAGQQTTITVAFLPTAVGAVSGSVSLVSNAPTSPTSVALSGSGIAATLTLGINPTSLSFGNVLTGTTSATQNVTITNTGNSNVTISQIAAAGAGYTITGGSTPVTLTPSQNLVLGVQFAPASAGSVAGSISITSNATGSPATATLSGTGVVQHTVSLSWTASTSTISGYNVYRSTTSGSGYVKINTSLVSVLTYTDSNVTSGTTYFYVTTAVDSTGTESVFSNQATAVIP
ncbi:MAG TPA: immunoglobulin domain-containing protein [Candidatus Acidoferrum sp.]|nr:immunoglobulin domain-containing protein [Candidatus Acidoferrum sp.]